MAQVCRFYQMGSCKFGDSCKFQHPGAARNNRFQVFGSNPASRATGSAPYSLSKDTIEKDLTSEPPTWILSCYGPGRDAPEQLFGGYPREQSTDEIRLHYEKAVQAGKQQQALQEIQQLYTNAQQQMQNTVSNLDNAIQFIANGANKHPNRLDIISQTNPPGGTTGEFAVGKRPMGGQQQTTSPFGGGGTAGGGAFGTAPATGSAFGQPSTMGQRPSPFGAPAFGQPSQPSGSAFGKPAATPVFGSVSKPVSAFGTSTTPAFGQPSQPTSAFGQAPQPGSAFGQTSTLGARPSPFGAPAFGQPAQPASGGSAFGQPSQMGAGTSAFGQPSAMGQKPSPFGAPSGGTAFSAFAGGAAAATPFGQPGQKPSPFGQSSQPATTSPFGKPAQTATTSPFGQPAAASPFGQPAQPAAASPFGQPSQPATSSPFGAPAQTATASPFGQPVAASPFGAAAQSQTGAVNPFAKTQDTTMDTQPTGVFGAAQPAATTNVFGQPSQAGVTPSPFGVPTPTAAAAAPSEPQNPYPPGAQIQHPPPSAYSTSSMGRLTTWKGQPVTYRGDVPGYVNPATRRWVKIWFPNGPPAYNPETEPQDQAAIASAKTLWDAFGKTGRFDGLLPEVAPLRIQCRWDV
ncbi:hypothetical protein SAPIO_CDS10212 [Scedosporium apiospermum]|uniref:C3H1-type domain-containing protein n=1 Tax=Pseudallescheria apiosperma TaxID=563466 RepID=A0A084FUY5_PSEDA|nr:uncharacterized protein SAPIO_CDS10212 [Scedosporium apiospermum]KEZ38897.1 hypothetical protein SAPIO_CDS10212 [Scedosporium apiospermum]